MEAQQQLRPTAVATRRGRQLQPVQITDIDSDTAKTSAPAKSPQTRPAPPHPDEVASSPTGERIPLRTPKSQSSKSSLRSLFLRSKSSRSSFASVEPTSPLPSIAESKKGVAAVSSPKSAAVPSPTAPSATPRSIASSGAATPQALNSSTSNASLRPATTESYQDNESHTSSSWLLPPLFKAYPQALKHATLPTPNLSPEMILQADGHGRTTNAKKPVPQSHSGEGQLEAAASNDSSPQKRKGGKIQKRSRRRSYVASKLEWCQKHYVLATSGRFLQYSADGDFDRQPEKIMELGKSSIAFASDALPGKHWVIQVSQTVDSKNSISLDTRQTFLSRIGVAQRVTKTLFLVFENSDELASWLTVVRREIELLGGKHFVPEATRNKSTPDLHRYQSLRVNRQSSLLEKPRAVKEEQQQQEQQETSIDVQATALANPDTSEKATTSATGPMSHSTDKLTDHRSVPLPRLTETPSLSTLASITEPGTSWDGSRSSYVSLGTRTMSSSDSSSPAHSTSGPKHATSTKHGHPGLNGKGRSTVVSPVEQLNKPESVARNHPRYQRQRDHQTTMSGDSGGITKQQSNAGVKEKSNFTPNFSVPSFSKRYSTAPSTRMSSRHSRGPQANSQEYQPPAATQTNGASTPPNPCPDVSTEARAQQFTKIGRSISSSQNKFNPNGARHNQTSIASVSEEFQISDDQSTATQEPSTHTCPTCHGDRGRSSNSPSEAVPALPPPRIDFDFFDMKPTRTGLETSTGTAHRTRDRTEAFSRPSSMHATSTSPGRNLDRPTTTIHSPQLTHTSNPTRSRNPSRPSSIPHTLGLDRIAVPPSASASASASTEHPSYSETAQQRHSFDKASKRRSMPLLSYGPPPAPPPDYPLPEVPSHAISDYT